MYQLKFFIYSVFQIIAVIVIVLLLPLRFLRKIIFPRQFFSLWTGRPIINMGINAKAERLLGIRARSLVIKPYYVTNVFDYVLTPWSKLWLIKELLPLMVFGWICLCADRVHLYCNGLLPAQHRHTFNATELFLYRLLGIQLFCWTYGADVRSRQTTLSLGEPNCCTECSLVGKACVCDEQARKQNIERIKKYATAIFSMGDMIEYTPGSRNGLFFWPVDLNGNKVNKYDPVFPDADTARPLRIVHASNHRMFKGTHFLIEAIEQLKREGYAIELVLVEGMPNEKALAIYRSADVIFDQCLVGFHGFFAIEGMALGKPVMSFIRKPQEYLLYSDECPIINTQRFLLKNDLRKLAENRHLLSEIGMKGRRYIEKYFTLEAFSGRLANAYKELEIAQ